MDTGVRSIEELRAFASYLRSLGEHMEGEFEHARAEMYRVNEGWIDRENERFMQEFEQSVELISKIAAHMELYGTFINRKCDKLEEYQAVSM